MTALDAIALVLAGVLAVYLVYALLRGEEL